MIYVEDFRIGSTYAQELYKIAATTWHESLKQYWKVRSVAEIFKLANTRPDELSVSH